MQSRCPFRRRAESTSRRDERTSRSWRFGLDRSLRLKTVWIRRSREWDRSGRQWSFRISKREVRRGRRNGLEAIGLRGRLGGLGHTITYSSSSDLSSSSTLSTPSDLTRLEVPRSMDGLAHRQHLCRSDQSLLLSYHHNHNRCLPVSPGTPCSASGSTAPALHRQWMKCLGVRSSHEIYAMAQQETRLLTHRRIPSLTHQTTALINSWRTLGIVLPDFCLKFQESLA